jgi:5-methylcytosine-specific restriction endonuclease McrA
MVQTKKEKYLKGREWVKRNPDKRRLLDRLFYQRHKYRLQIEKRKKTNELKMKIEEVLGTNCFICDKVYPNRMVFHEIHCSKHPINYYYVLKHIENFIRLCRRCHNKFHDFVTYHEKYDELRRLINVSN